MAHLKTKSGSWGDYKKTPLISKHTPMSTGQRTSGKFIAVNGKVVTYVPKSDKKAYAEFDVAAQTRKLRQKISAPTMEQLETERDIILARPQIQSIMEAQDKSRSLKQPTTIPWYKKVAAGVFGYVFSPILASTRIGFTPYVEAEATGKFLKEVSAGETYYGAAKETIGSGQFVESTKEFGSDVTKVYETTKETIEKISGTGGFFEGIGDIMTKAIPLILVVGGIYVLSMFKK